jgi:O-methyltransferase
MTVVKEIAKRALYHFGWKLSRLDPVDGLSFYLQRMYERISGIEGDIVECGVGKMISFRILASLLRDEGASRTLWGYDSFEGFPEPTAEDTSARNPQRGEGKYIEAEDVAKFLRIGGFKAAWVDAHVKVVKGFFQDTLPKDSPAKIAFLHLDVDLYDSYRTCLNQLFPKVVPGGVVLFDEYLNKNENTKFPGAKKAIDEYLSGTKYQLSRDRLYGKYYLVKS